MELPDFLIEAKTKTYASEGGAEEIKLENGGRKLVFEKENLRYRDIYFGYNPFIEEERVWKDGKIFWGMNYMGRIISENAPAEEIYQFLKKALQRVPEEFPFRGPGKFEKGKFSYKNEIKGRLAEFSGKETIYFEDKAVYVLTYHGGFIKIKRQA